MRFNSPFSPLAGALVVVCGLGACQSSSSDYASKASSSADNKIVANNSLTTLSPKPAKPTVDVGSPVVISYSPIEQPEIASVGILQRETIEDSEAAEKEWKAEGFELLKSKSFDEAVIAFRSALSTSPEDAEVWGSLGRAYIRSGDRERGIECLEEAASIDPTNTAVVASLVRGHLKEDNFDMALDHAETLSTLAPDQFQSQFLLGRSYSVNKMWKESIEAFQAALMIKPEHTYANNNLGFVALQIGENEIAVQALEKATDQEDARAFMFNSLGIAYERIQKPVSAMTAFYKALEANPKFVKAIVNRERLTAALTQTQREEFVAWRDGSLFDDESPIEPDASLLSADASEATTSLEQSNASDSSTADALAGDSITPSNQ